MGIAGSATLTSGEKGAINFIKAVVGVFSFVLSVTTLFFGSFFSPDFTGGG